MTEQSTLPIQTVDLTKPTGKNRWRTILQHSAVVVGVLFLWSSVVKITGTPATIFPSPENVGRALLNQMATGQLWTHFGVTSLEVLLGFTVGCVLAFGMGVFVARTELLERTLSPFVVAFESIPKIALAPLFVVWFGFGLTPKILTTALVCFFPMFINTVQGMKASSQNEVDVLRSAGASKRELFMRLTLPNSMPYIFSALNICVILAVVGAVVAEYVGASAGLGYQILLFNRQLRTADAFSSIIALAVIGLIGHAIIRIVKKRFASWIDEVEFE